MKKSINFSEILLWAVMLAPFIYLATLWSGMPDTVPTHFNAQGEADGWGSKNTLVWLPALMIFLTYGLFLLVPKIDPKGKIEAMGRKYQQIKWIIIGLMSVLSFLIIHSAHSGGTGFKTNLLFVVFGLFFALLGNFFPTLKPNYFIGIRTPWTLESEEVWKKTHRMAGAWWMAGGIFIIIAGLFLGEKLAWPVFIGTILVITLVPVVYSYRAFKA